MTQGGKDMAAARAAMVAQIADEVAGTKKWLGKDALDARVMDAMEKVPRHLFIPEVNWGVAYENRAQPIGHGQTISQPYIVALMSDLAAVQPGDKVLEIGTGCGYQTAVLAELAARVDTIEVVPELARAAAERLARLGYGNIEVRCGDGALGWPDYAPPKHAPPKHAPPKHAPYDAILVTAAAWQRVPPALIEQLAPGGRLVVPVDRSETAGSYPFTSQQQDLLLITKDEAGKLTERNVLPVAFVPLIEDGDTRS